MTRIPAWADTPEARSILQSIIADPPESIITRGTWIEGGGVRHYVGKSASQLRGIYNRRRDKLCHDADAAFHTGTAWDEAGAEYNAHVLSELPDELIERLLREAAQEAVLDLTVQSLGGGAFRMAA